MKKITFLLLTISLFAVYNVQAQKQFAGEIRFETKLTGSDDPNLISSVPTQIIEVSILGNKSKTVVKSDMYAVTNVWDGDKETANMVLEITGMGKYFKKWSSEEWKEKSKFNDYKYQNVDEFKTICDYKCQKVVVTVTNTEDDSTSEVILYVTKEIGASKVNAEFPGLAGYPLMIMQPVEEYCPTCYITVEAQKVTPKKLKDIDFLLPSDAQNIDDNPEIKQMLGLE